MGGLLAFGNYIWNKVFENRPSKICRIRLNMIKTTFHSLKKKYFFSFTHLQRWHFGFHKNTSKYFSEKFHLPWKFAILLALKSFSTIHTTTWICLNIFNIKDKKSFLAILLYISLKLFFVIKYFVVWDIKSNANTFSKIQ